MRQKLCAALLTLALLVQLPVFAASNARRRLHPRKRQRLRPGVPERPDR